METGVGLWKRRAAEAAAELVGGKKSVGLGSGTTMAEVVKVLAKKKRRAVFIPASTIIEKAARKACLKLRVDMRRGALDACGKLDLVLDGADEVDWDFNLIKGRGGAHTREKILARAAKRLVIVVDRSKLVRRLGERSPVPVEVLPFAAGIVGGELAKLGGRPKLRESRPRRPFVTDNGNYLLDVKFSKITRPAELERRINDIPGVVDNGIFAGLADAVVVGHEKGVEILRTKRDFLRLTKV